MLHLHLRCTSVAVLCTLIVSLTFGTTHAQTRDVSGLKIPEKTKVANADVVLNGSGIRYALGGLVRVYVASLYLPQKRSTSAEIAALKGSRRMQLNMLRDISADDFAKGLLGGLRANLVGADKIKHFDSLQRLGIVFGLTPVLKKGDVIHVDSIAGAGTSISINGKRIGEAFPDDTFFDALLLIWVGIKPIDESLKPVLLGLQPSNDSYARTNEDRY
jgi:Chalcone isomerase-like